MVSDSPMITSICKNCGTGMKKICFIPIGTVSCGKLMLLFFVYGNCIAADKANMCELRKKIDSGIIECPDVEFHFNKRTRSCE